MALRLGDLEQGNFSHTHTTSRVGAAVVPTWVLQMAVIGLVCSIGLVCDIEIVCSRWCGAVLW